MPNDMPIKGLRRNDAAIKNMLVQQKIIILESLN
jgi:hypothetical protein